MTARTHDLFAATAGLVAIVYGQVPEMTLGTAVVAASSLFLGGMAPDLDEPGAQFWQRMPAGAGTILGKIVAPVFGSHRFVTHSLVGLALLGWVVRKVLEWSNGWLVISIEVVWWAFMLGAVSHLVADMLTKEGVPLLWPLPWKFGIPPFKNLRITTGGWMEKALFVGLVCADIWLVRSFSLEFLEFVNKLV